MALQIHSIYIGLISRCSTVLQRVLDARVQWTLGPLFIRVPFSLSSCRNMEKLCLLLWPPSICSGVPGTYVATFQHERFKDVIGGHVGTSTCIILVWPWSPLSLNPALGSSAILWTLTRPFLRALGLLNWLTMLCMGQDSAYESWGAPIHFGSLFFHFLFSFSFSNQIAKESSLTFVSCFPTGISDSNWTRLCPI